MKTELPSYEKTPDANYNLNSQLPSVPPTPTPPAPPVPVLPGLVLKITTEPPPATPAPATPNFDGQTLVVKHVTADATGCLDVQWGRAANGQAVWTWTCNNTDAQQWTFEQRTDGDYAGAYRLVSGVGNGNYCLDNRGDFATSGRMGIWSCVSDTHGAVANQTVTIAAAGNGYSQTFTKGNASVWLTTDRESANPKGDAAQTAVSGSAPASAVWRIGG